MWINVRDSKKTWERLLSVHLKPKRRRPDGGASAAEPVEPNSPRPLSGGAAAPLEFDE
jgi:hypothetical protein